MTSTFLRKLFPSRNDKLLKKYMKNVELINALEHALEPLTDEELKLKTEEFKARYKNGEELDAILVDAFAVVREASKRMLNMRHYDVQLVGGMALHEGKIAEMRTGEGKTLVSTLSAYLNGLTGRGVHIVTVNDYLAKRDYEWMSRVHTFLGLTVGLVNASKTNEQKKEAYNCDITYVVNSEIGFDYLRDNMKLYSEQMCVLRRGFVYAIVDEIDSILIDEARTPLIISGSNNASSNLYSKVDVVVKKLDAEDFEINEKHGSVQLTDEGSVNVEKMLQKAGLIPDGGSLYDVDSYTLVNHVIQSLKARYVLKKDKDYIVKDGSIQLVDEFTGRIMDGRRYSGGLHQAIEAKEGVKIQNENQTLASLTYQNFFRMYEKLSGMTGTAKTEAQELFDIYKLEVVEIPTHRPTIREDANDVVFKTEADKFNYITERVLECYESKRPVLIGTTSIGKSEMLSDLFTKKGIKHNVLNAKNHEKEANIISEAGRKGAITIATNMAGRGTDILLGGSVDSKILEAIDGIDCSAEIKRISDEIKVEHDAEREEVVKLGGLFVAGSERHESRRIDNQLCGRAGRLGDPGSTQFFLSLQDDLLRIFGGDKVDGVLTRLGFSGEEPIDHPWLNRIINNSQKKLEGFHCDMRKNVLKYDDIFNEQRKFVYEQREESFMKIDDFNDLLDDLISNINSVIMTDACDANGDVDLDACEAELVECYGADFMTYAKENIGKYHQSEGCGEYGVEHDGERAELVEEKHLFYGIDTMSLLPLINRLCNDYRHFRLSRYPQEISHDVTKRILISTLDECWKDHLSQINHLREAIHLRSYAQKDPLVEYKIEAFQLFQGMLTQFEYASVNKISMVEIQTSNNADDINVFGSKGLSGVGAGAADVDGNIKTNASEHESGAEGRKNLLETFASHSKNLVNKSSGSSFGSGASADSVNNSANVSGLPAGTAKVKRNEPCPCGSGKKFKVCHGA